MRKSRIYTLISILALMHCITANACFIYYSSQDNMIYRLQEDVTPFYRYTDMRTYMSPSFNRDAENLELWRKQSGTKITDEKLRWYVYQSSITELTSYKDAVVRELGEDGFSVLLLAKQCENLRNRINDPWYYPSKGDDNARDLRIIADAACKGEGRYMGRYVLQALRAMISTKQYDRAITLWEGKATLMNDDVIKAMAEREVAAAYLKNGQIERAKEIYARCGDICSLYQCGVERGEEWDMVLEKCPNSDFFREELQMALTHYDNNHIQRWEGDTDDARKILKVADKALADPRVKDKAMWYYSAAALYDACGEYDKALQYIKKGEKTCRKGTFISNSMRVLKLYVEVKSLPLNKRNMKHITRELRWVAQQCNANKKEVRNQELEWYFPYNTYYWADVADRILIDGLAKRMSNEGMKTEAALATNMGTFMIHNMIGNNPQIVTAYPTPLTNPTTSMTDTMTVAELTDMYNHLTMPKTHFDKLVAEYGNTNRSYWCDIIGTRCIGEHKYNEAQKWLAQCTEEYENNISTAPYFDRDPFCFKFGMRNERRNHLPKRITDYKMQFAKDMENLYTTSLYGRTANERGKAMVMYGVGMRNQTDWCWALTRNYDSSYNHEELIDYKGSRQTIDKGLAMIESAELKAELLHLLARNLEVMRYLPNTKTARYLQQHCDMWRDYMKG